MYREPPKRLMVIFFIFMLLFAFGRSHGQEAEFLTKIYTENDTVFFKILHAGGELELYKFPLIVAAIDPPDSVVIEEEFQTLRIKWNPNTEPDLAGYRVHYGVGSQIYTNIIDVGNMPEIDIPDLMTGETYYFAVTAYDTAGNESLYSDEIQYPPAEILLKYESWIDDLRTWPYMGLTLDRPTSDNPTFLQLCSYKHPEEASILKEFELIKGTYELTFEVKGISGLRAPNNIPKIWFNLGEEYELEISKSFSEVSQVIDWPGGFVELRIWAKDGYEVSLRYFKLEKID